MVVNRKKTAILCVSDSQTYEAACCLENLDGTILRSGRSMKVLGFHLPPHSACPCLDPYARHGLGPQTSQDRWIYRE